MTMSSQGNDGYYSNKIIWEESQPDFGEEGDSGTIWIGVSHEDYFSYVVKASGILSDTLNVVPDIQLTSTSFSSSEISGRIVDVNGEGINGVQVLLDLTSTEDVEQDYATTSATIEEVIGAFRFQDVTWQDSDPDFGEENGSETSSSETAHIYVDDTDFYSINTASNPIEITLTSNAETELSQNIEVRRGLFSVPYVRGKVLLDTTSGLGENGVRVVLDLLSTEDQGDYETTTSSLEGEKGYYQFDDVVWEDNTPEHVDTDLNTDKENIRIYVDDTDYYSVNNEENPIEATITSDQASVIPVASNIVVKSAVFSATITGQVILGEGGSGENGITVVLDLASTISVRDYVTTTVEISSQLGMYRFLNVTWIDNETLPTASDTEQIRIYIDDDAYTSDFGFESPYITEIEQDEDLSISIPLVVSRTLFACPRISGKVVDGNGSGINGARMVLDLSSTVDITEDYVVITSTIDSVTGSFQFLDVGWRDENPDSANTDTEEGVILVVDPVYESDQPATLTLSADQAQTVTDIVCSRTSIWKFEVTLTGLCYYREGAAPNIQVTPIPGVEVTVRASVSNDASLIDTNADPIVAQTDNEGSFTVNVLWTRAKDYNPLSSYPDAPPGQDILLVDISYSSNTAPGNQFSFTDISEFQLKSWLDPNSVLDAVDTNPLP